MVVNSLIQYEDHDHAPRARKEVGCRSEHRHHAHGHRWGGGATADTQAQLGRAEIEDMNRRELLRSIGVAGVIPGHAAAARDGRRARQRGREAWIAGVTKHYPGEPKPVTSHHGRIPQTGNAPAPPPSTTR